MSKRTSPQELEAFYAGFKRVETSKPVLQVGDRVIVTNREHPHHEEVGTVTTAPRMISILGGAPKLWLEVKGEWETFGAQPHEVRCIRDLS